MLLGEKLQNIWKKPILMKSMLPFEDLILSYSKDINKALHRRFFKGYNEHTGSEWSFIRVCIKMMKILTLNTEVHNCSLLYLKDNIMSFICCHTYRGHIRRLMLIASHFPYAATHRDDKWKAENVLEKIWCATSKWRLKRLCEI